MNNFSGGEKKQVIKECSASGFSQSLSYQHYHGIMLVKLNHLAVELKLSHAEYHLMGVIIGYWNKKYGKSFPTVKILAQQARMSLSTVNKCLANLTTLGLLSIQKEGDRGRHNYYLNHQKFFDLQSNPALLHEETPGVTAWGNTINNNKESFNKKKKTARMLNNNNSLAVITTDKEKRRRIESKNSSQFQYLKQFKYWKHKLTNKIYQVKPDIGTHILFKYESKNQSVHLYEDNLIDSIMAFEPLETAPLKEAIPSECCKSQILEDLVKKKDFKEAQMLSKLWKIPLNINCCAS